MKRNIFLVAAITLGVGLTVILLNGIGWAQNSTGDHQISSSTSSAPIPEGVQIQFPPDRPTEVDPLDNAERASFNASLRIAGSALKPRENTSGTLWTGAGGGGCMYVTAGSTYGVFNLPLYLPQGSTIKYLRMYYSDTNVTNDSQAWFTIYDLYGDIVAEYPVSSSGNTGNGYATTDEITETINYESYSYTVNWRPNELGSDMQVCGFRIYYQTPPGSTYLPLIEKGE